MRVGATLYLRNDLGDNYKGKSVVVPRGTKGILRDIVPSDRARHGRAGWMALIDVPDSPGQPHLTTHEEHFDAIWEYKAVVSAWDVVVSDFLGGESA